MEWLAERAFYFQTGFLQIRSAESQDGVGEIIDYGHRVTHFVYGRDVPPLDHCRARGGEGLKQFLAVDTALRDRLGIFR